MSNPAAIVTGGASGPGLEIAKSLLSRGWSVVLWDTNPVGQDVARGLGREALWLQIETLEWNAQVRMFEKAFKWRPQISLFVAYDRIATPPAASYNTMTSNIESPQQKIDLQEYDTDVSGAIYGIKLFLHHFLSYKPTACEPYGPFKGQIIIIGSKERIPLLPSGLLSQVTQYALLGLSPRYDSPSDIETKDTTINWINSGLPRSSTYSSDPLISVIAQKYVSTSQQLGIPHSAFAEAFHEARLGWKAGINF